jgi:hypothetical protein
LDIQQRNGPKRAQREDYGAPQEKH